MTGRVDLPAKLAGETKVYTFDFSSALANGETLSAPAVTASVYSGTDAAPSSLISGVASASGAVVSQKITGGTLGVLYELLCTVTTSLGQTLLLSGYIAIVPEVP